MKSWDLLVVGGGPAGLSAALVATLNNVDTLVFESQGVVGGQVRRADAAVPDVLGLPSRDGQMLADRFAEHVREAKVTLQTGVEILSIRCQNDEFTVSSRDSAWVAKRVLLATGSRPRRLEVPGETLADHDGSVRKEVSRYVSQDVVVVGGGDEACDVARCLFEAGARVTLLVRREIRARPLFSRLDGVVVRKGVSVRSFEGEGRIERVLLSTGEVLPAQAAFVRIGAELALFEISPRPAMTPDGRLVADADGQTSVKGLYAAGDLIRAPQQRYISAAVADGTIVARAVEESLDPQGRLRSK